MLHGVCSEFFSLGYIPGIGMTVPISMDICEAKLFMHAVKLAHGCGLLIPGIIQDQICRIWMNACFWSYFLHFLL